MQVAILKLSPQLGNIITSNLGATPTPLPITHHQTPILAQNALLQLFPKMSESWQSISKRKKEQQASRIPKEWLLPAEYLPSPSSLNVLSIPRKCGILDEQDLKITENYDATALIEELAAGRLKSVDVTRAFCKVILPTYSGDETSMRLIKRIESSNRTPIDELSHRNSIRTSC
jgi:hypothetical protein